LYLKGLLLRGKVRGRNGKEQGGKGVRGREEGRREGK